MLLGRSAERARLQGLIARAYAGTSAALLVTGEPGIGKTALLEDAIDVAGAMPVMCTRGVQSEAELPFAALHDLLHRSCRSRTATARSSGGPSRSSLVAPADVVRT